MNQLIVGSAGIYASNEHMEQTLNAEMVETFTIQKVTVPSQHKREDIVWWWLLLITTEYSCKTWKSSDAENMKTDKSRKYNVK